MIRHPRRRVPVPRVLFLQSSLRFAADAQVHAALMRHLPAHGVDVHVAYDPGGAATPSESAAVFAPMPGVHGIATGFGPRGRGRGMRGALRLAFRDAPATIVQLARLVRYARREGITAVHATEKTREALFAWAVARLSGAAIAIHLHVKVEGWFSAPTRWVMRRAERLVAISEFVAESAVGMGFDRRRVRVALNALAPQDGAETLDGDRPAATRLVLDELGAEGPTAIISIVARMNPWKGHAQLFEAVASMPAGGRDVLVVVAGEDDGSEAQLRAQVDALGIGDRVRFIGFHRDVPRIMLASDVYAMPSFEEPFGLVYLEAMAAGTPVIALRTGGTPEVVVDGVTGLLSDPGDGDALAAHLSLLITDRELAARMGTAGKQRVAAHFTQDRLAADVAAIYRELLAER